MGLPSCVGLLQLRVQITRPNEPLSRFMPREQPPPSEDAHEPSGGRSPLRPDQRETADELRALDPHLAGLYEHALELLPRIREPGIAYFVAQAGREITRGVGRKLREDSSSLSTEELEDVPEGQDHRASIAEMLGLRPEDPRVDTWYQLHRRFTTWMKFVGSPPPPDEVHSAFERLSDLLYGRIGPYFATQAELDTFLAIEEPTDSDAERLTSYLLRPVQRHYFFSNLKDPRWIGPLERAHVFDSPPERRIDPESESWSPRSWPEGEYLVRVAAEAPEAVTRIFERIPKDLKNPAVWDQVAQAAIKLPPDRAARLVPALLHALRNAPPVIFTRTVAELTGVLAEAGREEAFEVADHLLFIARPSEWPESEVEDEVGYAVFRSLRSDTVLVRIGGFELRRFLKDVLPKLEALDRERTLKLLLSKVSHVVRLSEAFGPELAQHVWHEIFRSHGQPDPDDAVAQLNDALVGVAERWATQGADAAKRALKLVEEFGGEPFTRVGYRILAVAGHYLPEQLDAFFRSEEAIEAEAPAREIAAVVRNQFKNAPPGARKIFRYGLERGPDAPSVSQMLEWQGVDDPTDEDVQAVRRHWLRRRLFWFRGEIPDELRALAESVGVYGEVPSLRDQELAEVGFYSEGGFGWVGRRSPVEREELEGMSAREIVEFLSSWRPDPERAPAATTRGLEDTLSELAFENPEKALAIVPLLNERPLGPGYVRSLLNGLSRAVEAGKPVDWTAALELAQWTVGQAQDTSEAATEGIQWRSATSEALRLVSEGCTADRIPKEEAERVWTVLGTATESRLTWGGDKRNLPCTLEGALTAALNEPAGDLVRALFSAALWVYRSHKPTEENEDATATAAARTSAREHLLPLLESVLDRDGRPAVAAQAMLGHFIPQLHLLAPEWLERNAERLFAGGAESPESWPAWGAYLTRARLYDSVFKTLRPWYVKAAQAATNIRADKAAEESDWSVTKALAQHVMGAMLRGIASLGDSDRLIEMTFENVPVSDRSRAYWSLYRGWSDSEHPPPAVFIERATKLWEWRLDVLESAPEYSEVVEEAKGLGWLLRTPHIPDETVVRLGLRTMKLARGQLDIDAPWDRLAELAEVDVDCVFAMAEHILDAQLHSEYPYVSVERVKPLLERALGSGNAETRTRARRLIHRLGDRGFTNIGDLLTPR